MDLEEERAEQEKEALATLQSAVETIGSAAIDDESDSESDDSDSQEAEQVRVCISNNRIYLPKKKTYILGSA